MDWFARSLSAIAALGTVVTLATKWGNRRVQRQREVFIRAWKSWAISEDGRIWFRGYLSSRRKE